MFGSFGFSLPRWLTALLASASVVFISLMATDATTSTYTIGDPEYLRIFTKAKHQVWTEILSQGGYMEPHYEDLINYRPNDGTETVFVSGLKPKPRHFHVSEFYNGSMYMFGGLDKDMYFNDMWEYKLPLFASDRSKWYEQISFWQRDIQWLIIVNNRYTHNVIKDIYTSVCKDSFDRAQASTRSKNWEIATDGLTLTDPSTGHYRANPAADALQPGEQVSPVTGGDPLYTGLPTTGVDPLGTQQFEWLDDPDERWICEEMKMRYDFMHIPPTDLIQDLKRPSARFGVGSTFAFTDVFFTPETNSKSCTYQDCTTTVHNPIYTMEPVSGKMFSRLTNIDRVHQKRVAPHGSDMPVCQWNSATWQSTYMQPTYGAWNYTLPRGCRPQIIVFGGYDVDEYFLNDVWFYDIWNNSWSSPIIALYNYSGGKPISPRPRRFASVNVFRSDKPFRPRGIPDAHQNYTEIIYVMGGEAKAPIGPFQDVWGYSREHNQWIDLRPIGRIPSARVYDTTTFAVDTTPGGSGVITGYVIGGVFGGFKIDVMKYNCISNRFSSLYAEGAKPSARSYFTSTLYVDSIFVFGGRGWVMVDNIDKDDLWVYNITANRWIRSEPTGIIPLGRQGHTGVNFATTIMVFGGYSEPSLTELGTGDMNDVWRFDIELGALLADNKFLENGGGWTIYQNEIRGDTLIPWLCDDYTSNAGQYWGMPCRISYEKSTQQLLFIDGLHNDTEDSECSEMGCSGIGYLAAPKNYIRIGRKMYQGRIRYRYTKVYPSADDALQYKQVCNTLFLNSTNNPTINVAKTLPCGDYMTMINGTYSEEVACPMRIDFFTCVKSKGCMDLSRNYVCSDALKNCDIDAGVLCAPRRDAAFDTKDDLLLVGKYQVLSFDILDELVPYPNKMTLVDVDLDERKGWKLHGTNGSAVPTREEFIDVLETLQMILVRCDYWPSMYFRENTNLDYLGLVAKDATPEKYFDNKLKGNVYNHSWKLGQDGALYPFGTLADRPGTEASRWESPGIWKYMVQKDAGDAIIPVGRRQTHGEIVGLKEIEMFEAAVPMFD